MNGVTDTSELVEILQKENAELKLQLKAVIAENKLLRHKPELSGERLSIYKEIINELRKGAGYG
jgi:regulator of replication initiation timing